MSSLRKCILAVTQITFIAILVSCGGGSGSSDKNGTVEARIADAPIDGAQAVVIHFTEATVNGPDGEIVIPITDPKTGTEGRDIDLLTLQSGQWTGFFSQLVKAGKYSWIRLKLDLTKSYIQISGAQYALSCTSCANNGLKLNRSFTVPADGTLTLMLDFDLRKSITLPNTGSLVYKVRPTIRIVESDVSGNISGTVDPTLISTLGGFTGCNAYVFSGHDAQLDDIYIPFTGSVSNTQNNPVMSTAINFDTDYTYNAAHLPSGDYTVAVTCDGENDQADTDDTLVFSSSINTSVTAGESTVNIDF